MTVRQTAIELNEAQSRIVEWVDGPLLVSAGPGSGKTRVIIERIARLLEKGIKPESILATTFTRKAADEMNTRLQAKKVDVKKMAVQTMHSLCWRMIREHRQFHGWTVDDKDIYRLVVKSVVGYKYMSWIGVDVTTVESFIAAARNNLIAPDKSAGFMRERYRDPRYAQAYMLYAEAMADRRLITFDDMLYYGVRLLEQDHTLLDRMRGQYTYIMVDEFQDSNYAQLQLADLLARPLLNYMAVGDIDQAIYSWRGALPEFMLEFKEKYNAEIIELNTNYRCAPAIMAAAAKCIAHNEKRFSKELLANRTDEATIKFFVSSSPDDEAETVRREIQMLHEASWYCPKCTNALHCANESNPTGRTSTDAASKPTDINRRDSSTAWMQSFDDRTPIEKTEHRSQETNETGRVGTLNDTGDVQPTDEHSTNSRPTGSQQIDDRQTPRRVRQLANGSQNNIPQRQVDGGSIQNERGIHHGSDSTTSIPSGTPGSDGGDSRTPTQSERSSASYQRQHDRQSTREPRTVQHEQRSHANTSHETCSHCGTPLVKISGVSYGGIRVLMRVNAQSRAIEEEFTRAKIPFVVLGSGSFYERKEIKSLLAYLRLIKDPTDISAGEIAINRPFRFVGRRMLDQINERSPRYKSYLDAVESVIDDNPRASGRVLSFVDLVRSFDKETDEPADMLRSIVKDTNFIQHLMDEEGSDTPETSRAGNVGELIASASRFKKVDEFIDYIDTQIRLRKRNQREKTESRVQVMTIHKSKGTEAHAVFLIGANEGIIPHAKGVEEEERRLFYVAITRAKDNLYLSMITGKDVAMSTFENEASRFAFEAEIKPEAEETLTEPEGDDSICEASEGPLNANSGDLPDGSTQSLHGRDNS